MAVLPTIRSNRFRFSVKVNGAHHKIFSIIFHTGKISGQVYIFVEFPYFHDGKGLLSRLTFPANQRTAPSISLLPEGKKTTHLAKFTHPLDGNTHFSADGKILTRIRNQSQRLDASIPHFFTIQVQDVSGFELREDKKLTKKVTDLDFDFINDKPPAIKFIARWYKVTELSGTIDPNGTPTPRYQMKDSAGNVDEFGFIISPPESSPLAEYVMLVSCKQIPLLNQNGLSHFSFVGGFDKDNIMSQDLHFLGCTYPAEDFESLPVENIDFK